MRFVGPLLTAALGVLDTLLMPQVHGVGQIILIAVTIGAAYGIGYWRGLTDDEA